MASQRNPRAVPRRTGPGASLDRGSRLPVPATWPRYDSLLDSLAHPTSGRHIEQFTWCWYGPLDVQRFTAAWQSVVDRESVLRSAFAGEPPHLVVHDRARAEVARHPAGTIDWDDLREQDRLRGFDLRRPCPLRMTLIDPDGDGAHPAAPRRVLVTFHHALLDAWSVSRLLERLCRAYLAGGLLPGGERRPDIRDWLRWLERQDTDPARDFWTRAVPDGPLALLPAQPGPDTLQSGYGCLEVRLTDAEARAAAQWAAVRAMPDSSVLQAVWALLLYRAAGLRGSGLVGFGVTVSGRGIALDYAEGLLGPMRNSLPMVVRVDPAQRLDRLLAVLRDRALDLAAYEWVPLEQIGEWTGRPPDGRLLDSLVALESVPRPLAGLRAELADVGVGVELEHASGAHGSLPLTLRVRRGADGLVTLTLLHDRSRISDADAALLADQCARLLCYLPTAAETVTVADALTALDGEELPRVAPRRRLTPP
ncbi:hypothetical protein ABIA32_005995 [Streptacidiphilus sp. MAP12-20]|uniref:condensation domain-containing protein n=1 Tax=Streptacidiphilus sp. MAP12-20 TaxID=3156299 RepID=UPI0035114985